MPGKKKEESTVELNPTSIEDVRFDERDLAIFSIPDIKTRISVVQNYFFPRLEFLVRDVLGVIQNIYEINPYERINFIYRPSNRKTAKNNMDFFEAYVGISGKRRTDRDLTILNRKGVPYKFHPCYLFFGIDPQGTMYVEMRPFVLYVDDSTRNSFTNLVRKNKDLLEPILAYFHITYSGASSFVPLIPSLKTEQWPFFRSYPPDLPVYYSHNLSILVWSFIALYPILDSIISIGEGEEPRLSELLNKLRNYWLDHYTGDAEDPDREEESLSSDDIISTLPELDSYNFIRAGVWWNVLSRDNWTCCSCGRTPKDGVTLEVDHITPRSLGGTDEPENLQTLCKKCNVGKSNKDNTDLRRNFRSSR
ncbi:MAG: HNH endonuclease [Synergistaceae bacterium]|jgi:hypothetical protein|nr:HNH endonuclease [Synergistaceae bacterium]